MFCAWHTVAGMGVLAQRATSSLEILWWTLPLVVALLAAAAVVAYLKRWRAEPGVERLTPNDQLSQFRSLYERGELSAEEFARIRDKLGARIKQELKLPPQPDAGGAEPTPPESAPPASLSPGGRGPDEGDPDTNIRPGPPGAS